MYFHGNYATDIEVISTMRTLLNMLFIVLAACAGCSSATHLPAGPSNVLIVVNSAVPESVQLGKYYASKRSIEPRFICRVTCTDKEVIPDADFDKDIRKPIKAFIKDRKLADTIDYIVLARGIPIKTVGHWSVDSVLTCLDNEDIVDCHPNPYYESTEPFSHSKFGIYLVTRLDGMTFEDAKALVDRSLAAKPQGTILIDVDPAFDGAPAYKIVNDGMREAGRLLKERGINVLLNETKEFVVREDLMGYFSWGSHDGEYTDDKFKNLKFLPGSIAETAVSTSAWTLTAKRELQGKRSYVVDLIANGATGVKGYVYEPYVLAIASASILFDRYTSGRNLAESFYAASRFVHWRDLVIGDPLCAPYARSKNDK
jgi:uncharacterized protein (TIGR03790 family)